MIPYKRAGDTILGVTATSTGTGNGGRFRWRMEDEQEHRRDTIRELQGQGYTITQIAQKLQLSVPTIKRISARLHRESRENYQRLVQEKIPFEVDSTLDLYKSIKRQAKELAERTDNDAVRVRALDLLQRAGKEYIDLKMRGDYIKRSLDVAEYIQKKLNELPATNTTKLEDGEEAEEEYDPQRKF
jgi:transposase